MANTPIVAKSVEFNATAPTRMSFRVVRRGGKSCLAEPRRGTRAEVAVLRLFFLFSLNDASGADAAVMRWRAASSAREFARKVREAVEWAERVRIEVQ